MADKNSETEKEYRDASQMVSSANKIAQRESTRNEDFRDVSFDTYQTVGGERKFRKFEGGRIVGEFTSEQMESSIDSKMEDSFISEETERLKSKINAGQATAAQNPTEYLSEDGYRTEPFIVVINGVAVIRNFVIR